MHDTAFAIGSKFLELYAPAETFTVVEVGSQDVNGTLRDALPPRASYIGVDVVPGRNVDVVATGRALPLQADIADLAIASSVFEHDPAFWLTFLELCRITKPGGWIYLSSPSNGAVHRYPQDCWRFYPDAGEALAGWARQNGLAVSLAESFVADRRADVWNDFVAVYHRGEAPPERTNGRLHTSFPGAGLRGPVPSPPAESEEPTEDQRLLAAAAAALMALEERAISAIPGLQIPDRTEEHKRWLKGVAPRGAVDAALAGPPHLSDRTDPFAASYRIVDQAIGALTNRFDRFRREARRREATLRRLLRRGENALAAARSALDGSSDAHDQLWFHLDNLESTHMGGWAVLVTDMEQRVQIDILVGEERIASIPADQPRPHLAELSYGDGCYGFWFKFDEEMPIERTGARVIARWPGGQTELGELPAASGPSTAAGPAGSRSTTANS